MKQRTFATIRQCTSARSLSVFFRLLTPHQAPSRSLSTHTRAHTYVHTHDRALVRSCAPPSLSLSHLMLQYRVRQFVLHGVDFLQHGFRDLHPSAAGGSSTTWSSGITNSNRGGGCGGGQPRCVCPEICQARANEDARHNGGERVHTFALQIRSRINCDTAQRARQRWRRRYAPGCSLASRFVRRNSGRFGRRSASKFGRSSSAFTLGKRCASNAPRVSLSLSLFTVLLPCPHQV